MKKILAIAALVSLGAAAAYASPQGWGWPTAGAYTFGSTKSTVIKPSANVAFNYDGGSTGVTYTVAAFHAQGSKVFGTSSTETNIFYQDYQGPGVNGLFTTAPTMPNAPATGAAAFSEGWTASK